MPSVCSVGVAYSQNHEGVPRPTHFLKIKFFLPQNSLRIVPAEEKQTYQRVFEVKKSSVQGGGRFHDVVNATPESLALTFFLECSPPSCLIMFDITFHNRPFILSI